MLLADQSNTPQGTTTTNDGEEVGARGIGTQVDFCSVLGQKQLLKRATKQVSDNGTVVLFPAPFEVYGAVAGVRVGVQAQVNFRG